MPNKDQTIKGLNHPKDVKSSEAKEGERGVRLRNAEKNILRFLLEQHIEEESYFGNKENHYKMCKELLIKL